MDAGSRQRKHLKIQHKWYFKEISFCCQPSDLCRLNCWVHEFVFLFILFIYLFFADLSPTAANKKWKLLPGFLEKHLQNLLEDKILPPHLNMAQQSGAISSQGRFFDLGLIVDFRLFFVPQTEIRTHVYGIRDISHSCRLCLCYHDYQLWRRDWQWSPSDLSTGLFVLDPGLTAA